VRIPDPDGHECAAGGDDHEAPCDPERSNHASLDSEAPSNCRLEARNTDRKGRREPRMRRFTEENAKTMQAARSGRQGDCDPEKEEIALQASGPERAWSMHHADRKNPSTIHAKRERTP
jgi:hypothetical protein